MTVSSLVMSKGNQYNNSQSTPGVYKSNFEVFLNAQKKYGHNYQ